MIQLDKVYPNQYFKKRGKTLSWRAPIVCETLKRLLQIESAIDVGCAVGDLVAEFIRLGVDAAGLEGAHSALPHLMCPREVVLVHDLRVALPSPKRYELVTCFEVVEHIEQEFDTALTANLQALADKWLVMSAAPPGQLGIGHVNCQPNDYWINRMDDLDFMYDPVTEDQIKKEWAPYKHKPGIKAFYQNLLVFRRARHG